MRAAYVVLVVAPLLVLPACRMNEKMTGAVGGAAAGGLIGAVTGASGGTVLVLIGAGALAGYLIGDYLADQACCGNAAPSPGGCCAPPATYAGYCTPANHVQGARASEAPAPTPVVSGVTWNARVAYEKGRAAATAEEAQAAYEESIRLDPSRPEPWNGLGLLALVQGDRTLARTHMVRALELDPRYAPAVHNLDRLDRGL